MLRGSGITPIMVGFAVSSGPPEGASFTAHENKIRMANEDRSIRKKILTDYLSSHVSRHYRDQASGHFPSFQQLYQSD